MRIAYFDCFSGASGDMILGSLLDAGAKLGDLRQVLKKLPLDGYTLSTRNVIRGGFSGKKFNVRVTPQNNARSRGLEDILRLLAKSGLSQHVKDRATSIFNRLAEAEARAHGKPKNEVHFHEVGAVDSIVDIVGAAIALDLLKIDIVHCSPIALGNGFIQCQHGRLPVPAPGTAHLLKGIPVRATDVDGELTTPTGVAVLTSLATTFGSMPAMTIESVGVGAGLANRPSLPNLLRVFIGSTPSVFQEDHVAVVETNIDDMSPELLGIVVNNLLRLGALDAYFTPIYMKKNRPAVKLTVLVSPEKLPQIQRAVFHETSTFGMRVSLVCRSKLEHKSTNVKTHYGSVRIKIGKLDGKTVTRSPEYDDCLKLAKTTGVPLRTIYEAANVAAQKLS